MAKENTPLNLNTSLDLQDNLNDPVNITPSSGVVPQYNLNFDKAYPDMTGVPTESISDLIRFEESVDPRGSLDGIINPAQKDMIDAAAVDLDQYAVTFNDMFSNDPGRASLNFNPFQQSSGIPDLNTDNGRKTFMSAAQSSANTAKPNEAPGYRDPFFYGAKRYNLDRYYRHPRFADLGFHPFANNEEYYQANSSKWDNFTRTRGQWSAMFGPAFTSGWRAIGDLFQGEGFHSDLVGAYAMQDAMRIGASGS